MASADHADAHTVIRTFFHNETARFIVTGGSAAALFYLLTLVFLFLGIAPFVATLVAYALAFAFSYSVQHAWTFRGRRAHRHSFPRYAAAQAVAALVAALVARVCGASGAVPAVVAAASTLSGSVLSYLFSKFWVFAPGATRGGVEDR